MLPGLADANQADLLSSGRSRDAVFQEALYAWHSKVSPVGLALVRVVLGLMITLPRKIYLTHTVVLRSVKRTNTASYGLAPLSQQSLLLVSRLAHHSLFHFRAFRSFLVPVIVSYPSRMI